MKWEFSLDGWTSVLLRARHIRRDAVARRRASVDLLALGEAVADDHRHHADRRLPDRLFHRHARRERDRDIWLFLITIPFWTNLLDPHLRGAGDHPQRRHRQQHPDQCRPDRPAGADAVHRLRHHARHGLRLSAADGAAALRQHGEARLPPGRGGLRPLCEPLQRSEAHHLPAGEARRHRRLDPRLHPLARRLCARRLSSAAARI